MADYIDYYSVLGVPKSSGEAEIKSAYRKLALKHHPDRNQGNKAAEAKFKEINEAYEVLSDPQKRKLYDQFGREGAQQGYRPPPGGPQRQRPQQGPGGFQYRYQDGQGADFSQFGDFSDFFKSMFGGGQGFDPFSQPDKRGGRSELDMEAELQLSIEELIKGGHKQLAFSYRAGRKTETREINVKIPRGLRDGSTIRLRGHGREAGGRAGDLYLKISVQPDPRFEIDGDDLRAKVEVLPWDAALGAEVSVPAPGGPVKIKLPPGTGSGRRLRIGGRGLPREGGGHGDLYAVITLALPDKLSPQQLDLFRKLKELE
ncbi:MAG: DnaJ C-terminal domain-containing protein [Elusimicrobiales bacterium]|nr:DnaJ C-terminal domain-containing protein [Elusimicrobiales bacterium]